MRSREYRSSTFYQFFYNDVVELDLRHDGLRPPALHRTMHQIRGEHGGQVGRVHLPREMQHWDRAWGTRFIHIAPHAGDGTEVGGISEKLDFT